ncbi:MAG: aspartate aminotransferase family protein [Rhodospirillales bacterium]|jgi:putrescine---pyruvate transaminase|nr:aspartate aminotransferase family protein [Rhodospirillales bacterium]MBT4040577.1 aspartate aminotransferase family protein [Rhodospirillales bacterium]MBT4627022.1 aspartate aminotransferase family protein [Rhodospirillales bacterium]MBT5352219.1 aspartate aminotransferase family protein [Rhodospirillales bacterium]MBT6111056.1 aspartate aminotransferase family protein [Rhodospirillales bacterium]
MERTHNWTTEQWVKADQAHHMHPFTDYADHAVNGSRIITEADGVFLTDSDGNKILDGMAGLWCTNVGYGRKELADVAHKQMMQLPFYNTFFNTSTMPPIELAGVLAEITPEGLNHAFYASSGSEANDTIVRMVRHYWNIKGKPNKKTFISREYAYHGTTMAAASLGGMSGMHRQADLPLPGFEHVMPPYWYVFGGDMSPEEFGLAAAKAVEDKIVELGADNVAAFIGEPIQGAGAVIIPPETYWPEIQRICEKYDILLIADEVICGFGRTGNWFGSDHFNIKPDLMPIAKGLTSGYLPLSAVMTTDDVKETLGRGGDFEHGFTYSGHPVACAVALANIEIIKRENLVEKVHSDTGPYLGERLAELEDHPLVGEVRHLGLIASIELAKNKETRELFDPSLSVGPTCKNHCSDNGLVMRATRDVMVMSPPLIISRDEIDMLVDRARKALDATAVDFGVM